MRDAIYLRNSLNIGVPYSPALFILLFSIKHQLATVEPQFESAKVIRLDSPTTLRAAMC